MTDHVNYDDYRPKEVPTCDESWAENELSIIADLNQIVNGPVEGNYCFKHETVLNKDSVPIKERSWKREFLRRSIKNSKVALEIGFNAGHSATIMLCANPNLKLMTIDMCRYPYTLKCADYLSNKFPGRFGLFKGTSQEVLRNKKSTLDFDFIHIDGGHGIADFYFDVDWSEKNLKKDGLLLIDDAFLPDYLKYIGYKVQQEVFREVHPTGMKSSGENMLLQKIAGGLK
jgi:predicted O-methyltransferase YrrM